MAYLLIFKVEVPYLLRVLSLVDVLGHEAVDVEAQPVVVAVGGYTLLEVRAHDGDLHSACLGQLVGLLEEAFLSLIETVLKKVRWIFG